MDHVQLAMPAGGEPLARWFYDELLGLPETAKPAALAARGGCWFHAGTIGLHLGVEDGFRPARKAHPALMVDDVEGVRSTLAAAGHACVDADDDGGSAARFHTHDPFGNRIEFTGPSSGTRLLRRAP